MTDASGRFRRLWFGALTSVLLTGLVACSKKTDPSVASAGGGAYPQRNVLTMKGAAR